MAYPWFTILESWRLGERPREDDESVIVDWESLGRGFITQLRLRSDMERIINVDCFPLLYELLNAAFGMRAARVIEVTIGEGVELLGTPLNGDYELRVIFEQPNRDEDQTLLSHVLSVPDAMLFISIKTAELVKSLEKINVDVEHYLLKFPPSLYKSGMREPRETIYLVEQCRKLAECGDVRGLFGMAGNYSFGAAVGEDLDVENNWEEAYFWIRLTAKIAATEPTPHKEVYLQPALKRARQIAKYLTPEQIAAVDKRVKVWKPKS